MIESEIVCPICKSKLTEKNQKVIWEFDVSGKIINCSDCDVEYTSYWQDEGFVQSLYEGDSYVFHHNASKPENLKFDEYKVRLEHILNFVNKDSNVLEVGCGDGKFMQILSPHVKSVEGIELSPPQVSQVRKMGFVCYEKMLTELVIDKKYDVICMYAVLEHIPNVSIFLNSIQEFLNPDAKVIIEVPNRKNVLYSSVCITEFKQLYYKKVHLYYFTPDSLKLLLNKHGFNPTITTYQQASLTNHFNWFCKKLPQKNADFMTSITLEGLEVLDDGYIDILDELDNFYRELLAKSNQGDLMLAVFDA
jgi:SAM-dependent methyltransferase